MTPDERLTRIENSLQAVVEVQAKHEAGIQDLVRVSRTLVDSQQKVVGMIGELAEEQRQTWTAINMLSGKVDKLADNIDRFLRGLHPNGSE